MSRSSKSSKESEEYNKNSKSANPSVLNKRSKNARTSSDESDLNVENSTVNECTQDFIQGDLLIFSYIYYYFLYLFPSL
jgi:hypothetical protein